MIEIHIVPIFYRWSKTLRSKNAAIDVPPSHGVSADGHSLAASCAEGIYASDLSSFRDFPTDVALQPR
jgi:hypothetical protein